MKMTANPDPMENPHRDPPVNHQDTTGPATRPGSPEWKSLTNRARGIGNLIDRTVKQADPWRRTEIENALQLPLTPMTATIAALVIIQAIADTPPPYRSKREDLLSYWKELLRSGSPTRFRPILPLAGTLLAALPPATAQKSMPRLKLAAENLTDRTLPGRIIQKYIPMRKQAGVYHTRPEAAALMANLAVPEDRDWSNPETTAAYRIADYSCGTGELLTATYRRVRELCTEHGGTPRETHADIIENSITAIDILPASVAITAEALDGLEERPVRTAERTRAVTMKYGPTGDGGISLGSLDLLVPDRPMQPGLRPIARGNTPTPPLDLQPGTQDLVIMNPPFTRNPQPGLFSPDPPGPETGQLIDLRLSEVLDETRSNRGNGLSLPFSHLADRMVRPGGAIALLLPTSALSAGPSLGRSVSNAGQERGWANLRRKLAQDYTGVITVTIAAHREQDASFSDDTTISETVITARKTLPGEQPGGMGCFITLRERPRDTRDARLIAQAIRQTIRDLGEEAPGTNTEISREIRLEGESRGAAIITELPQDDIWQMAGVIDQGIIQAVKDLREGRIELGTDLPPATLPVIPLGEIAEIGAADKRVQEFMEASRPGSPSHQVLQHHDCTNQKTLEINGQEEMSVRTGMERREPGISRNKSRLHLSNNCRYNSQPTTACMTGDPSMGGQGWPSLHVKDGRYEKALTVWLNSSLGLITHWAVSNRTRNGLGYLNQTQTRLLPVLNIAMLTETQLDRMTAIFDENRRRTLRPASMAGADPLRADLDRRIIEEVLGLGEETTRAVRDLCSRWCREPSVEAQRRLGEPKLFGARAPGRPETHGKEHGKEHGRLSPELSRDLTALLEHSLQEVIHLEEELRRARQQVILCTNIQRELRAGDRDPGPEKKKNRGKTHRKPHGEILEDIARENKGLLRSQDAARTMILSGLSQASIENLRKTISRTLKDNPSWKKINPGTFALVE